MINLPPISVLFKIEPEDAALSSLLAYLKSLLPIKLSVQSHLTNLNFPPDDSIANMRVLDAIAEAARTGRTVKVQTAGCSRFTIGQTR